MKHRNFWSRSHTLSYYHILSTIIIILLGTHFLSSELATATSAKMQLKNQEPKARWSYYPAMIAVLQFFILLVVQSNVVPVSAFQLLFTPPRISRKVAFTRYDSKIASVAVNADELDKSLGLTPEERTVVNVHRLCSPSVVYVTSVLAPMRESIIMRRRQHRKTEEVGKEAQTKLPRGTSLGSGSGFVIDSAGYLLTNYHVIQRAYEANQAILQYKTFWSSLAKNTTKIIQNSPINFDSALNKNVESVINDTFSGISGVDITLEDSLSSRGLPAQVFVRFGTNGGSNNGLALYHQCEIVDVLKEQDIAILRCTGLPSMKPLSFGSSSDLLVGQSLLAIGNPFGLDRTITSGLVSALGRSVTGVAGNEITNCIQTDCAINPGVSISCSNILVIIRVCRLKSQSFVFRRRIREGL